ncbi:hypothetical protein [Crocosphaera sp. XPORK-15E]|uniref:hypothetical protein n=1 Tax=Crocosphaera sp. XPORK-15E TaxID=3110247 RepID=UPI002B21ED8E|nr:hypothetical protein [Crocosphaera sp. XPORK-15E]MEA5537000.1 hypothetical protein [Crocosphaera sp. XPORK-15E]
MINTKAIVYSSIASTLLAGAATLIAGTAAQAQEVPIPVPEDKPLSITQSSSVTVDGVTVNFDYTIYPLDERMVNGQIDYLYDILQPFYIIFTVDTETEEVIPEVIQGTAPGDATFDYVQYDELSAILDPTGTFGFTFRDLGAPSVFNQEFITIPAFSLLPGERFVNFTASLAAILILKNPQIVSCPM